MAQNEIWSKASGRLTKLKRIFIQDDSNADLSGLLSLSVVNLSLAEKIHWVDQILKWLFRGPSQKINIRFKYFFQVLEQNPVWKANFQNTFVSLIEKCTFLEFFTHIGLAVDHGMWGDLATRVFKKLIPSGTRGDFQEIIADGFQTEEEIALLAKLSPEILTEFQNLALTPAAVLAWKRVNEQREESILFLSVHIAHYGIGSEIISRLNLKHALTQSSFLHLSQTLNSEPQESEAVLIKIADCERDVALLYQSLEQSGVSVDVVNRLETISLLLERLKQLLKLRNADLMQIRSYLLEVAEVSLQGRSIFQTLKRHFQLLSRKVVERNGQSGEHYIAKNSSEFYSLFKSAVGGGVIVVVMTVFKSWVIQLELAPLFLASAIWIIYSIGFLTMQFTGATLATKIPSFTASRLASLIKVLRRKQSFELGIEFRAVLKSQTLALIGNLLGVIPFAWLVSLAFQHLFGGYHLLSEHYGMHVLEGLNPFFSFAIPLGMLTGVHLWLSSLAGGWFENWIVFNRIPESISNHFRLRHVFGQKKTEQFATWVMENASGIATNITLGFLFGFVPLLGTLIGVNLNSHHVTISTATAAFSIFVLHPQLGWIDFLEVGLGLVLVGCMNFGVSFGIALFVASTAQGMRFLKVIQSLRIGLARKQTHDQ